MAETAPWSRAQNFVDNVSDGNYELSGKIFTEHDSKLHSGIADPEILAIYNFFHPFRMAYYTAESTWNTLKGQGGGGTVGTMVLIDDLSGTKIRVWDVAIQAVYDQKSQAYKNLLPKRRTPFQTGSLESRIEAVNSLILAIGTIAQLQTLKGQITAFYNLLVAARDGQIGGFTAIDNAVTAMETARLAACQAMFKDYGSLVVKFYMNPVAIENWFPVDLLSTKQQTLFTGHTPIGETDHIFKRKMEPENHIHGISTGDDGIQLFYTDGLTEVPQGASVTIAAHSQLDFAPAAAGYTDAKRHLYIKALGSTEAAWSVEIL
ncbi:MAG: hypothetical protein NTX03_09065 [Bacteroidetes bacterium]|nr:hypothetical protein [Bacteroidota bacterium]